jgi:hypothetical protein
MMLALFGFIILLEVRSRIQKNKNSDSAHYVAEGAATIPLNLVQRGEGSKGCNLRGLYLH